MIIKTILPVFLVQKQSCQGEEHPNFSLFSLCVTVSSCLFPKAEKSLVLKVVSLYNNETFDSIRDEIFSWCYQLLFIWSIITKKSLQLICFYFEVENGAMKIPYTIWLPYQVVWLAENDGNPVFWLVTQTGSTGMSSHVPSRDCPLLILHRKDL